MDVLPLPIGEQMAMNPDARPIPSGHDLDQSSRRVLSARQSSRLERLTEAAVAELRENGYEGLTVRSVAARCGVAPATAYTYFASKNHLVAEIFWRRLRALPEIDAERSSLADDVIEVMRSTASIVADDPAVAAACSVAILAQEPEVQELRNMIGLELVRRIEDALGDSYTSAHVSSLTTHWAGAFLMVGMGNLTFEQMSDQLDHGVRALLR